jgi:hypothetical protein
MSAAPLAARVAVVRVLALREPVVPVPAQLPVLRVLAQVLVVLAQVPPDSGVLVRAQVVLLAQVPVLVHLVLAPVVLAQLAVEPAVRLLSRQ